MVQIREYRNLIKLCVIIVAVGGINWLVTGIRSNVNDNEEVSDLLNLIKMPQFVSNIIYYIVFVCSMLVLYAALK